MLDGTKANLTFQVGTGGQTAAAVTPDTNAIVVSMANVGTLVGKLAVDSLASPVNDGTDFDVTDHATASETITKIDTAIKNISGARSDLGASQNRLESAGRTIAVSKENLSAAASRITDVDMAEEMVSFTRSNILSQAGTAMLSQANQSSQGVLKLLG